MADTAAERRHRVADTIASGRLEGLEPAPAYLADAREYIDGRLSAPDFLRRAQRRWGVG